MWVGLSAGAHVLFFGVVLGFVVQLKLALGGRNVVAVLGVSEDISSDWEVQVLSGVFWGFVYRGTSEVRIVIGSISGFLMI